MLYRVSLCYDSTIKPYNIYIAFGYLVYIAMSLAVYSYYDGNITS